MNSNRVKFCPKTKNIEVLQPEHLINSVKCLSIGEGKNDSHFIESSSNSSQIVIKSHYLNQREKFDSFFSDVIGDIYLMSLVEKDRDKIYELFDSFTNNFSLLILANLGKEFESKISTVQQYVLEKIQKFDSPFKRENELRTRETYVAPIEKAIGLKWKTKVDIKNGLPNHKIVQQTYQYVPLLSTIKSLLLQPEFLQMYLNTCLNPDHNCDDNIYRNFCCSSVSHSHEIFKDKTALRIQIGIDDFDPCDALKTKAVTHKICAFYFTIQNIADAYLSKNDNMYLIALCETTNLKQENISINDINALITSEIKELETVGISVNGRIFKGSIINVTGDNLGANGFSGFIESFNGRFCRACDITKEESERATKEDPAKMRTKESYAKCVNAAEKYLNAGKKIDFKATKGVKRNCPFNSLNFFHIIDNVAFDIMHDVNEGAIPFVLSHLFMYMNEKKIMSSVNIQIRVRDFNYGELSKRDKPSDLKLDRKNLGQNASQSHCLFINLPFIFVDCREQLEHIWMGVECLLRCVEIMYSKEISDNDVEQLAVFIEYHLKWLQECFEAHLLPKHHFLTHYPNAIPRIGPLIYFWMMRVDSKHQFFTHQAKNTNNFVNITKTLAKKHQAMMTYKTFTVSDIQPSKLSYNLSEVDAKHMEFILSCLGEGIKNELHVPKFASFNSFSYRRGLIIVVENAIYEIIHVLSLHGKIFLLSHPYRVIKFESFLNSFEIECDQNSTQFKLVDPKKMNNPKSYEKKFVQQKMYIICDTLHVRKACMASQIT